MGTNAKRTTYLHNRKRSEQNFFQKFTQNMQNMLTIWIVILDSAEIFLGTANFGWGNSPQRCLDKTVANGNTYSASNNI